MDSATSSSDGEMDYVGVNKDVRKKVSNLSALTVDELAKKVHDYRRANITLLESNRQFLLQSQESKKMQFELGETKSHLLKLKSRVRALEENPHADIVKEIRILSRQFSNKDLITENDETNVPVESDTERISMKCTCGSLDKLKEVVIVNHAWEKDYSSLKNEHLKVRKSFVECETTALMLQTENENLRRQLKKATESTIHLPPSSGLPNIDDIEALKQQMIIYKEDFQETYKEVIRLNDDLSKMKIKLENADEMIQKLNYKNSNIKQNLNRVTTEKQNILSELRRLSVSGSRSQSEPTITPYVSPSSVTSTLASHDVIPHAGFPKEFYGGSVSRDDE